MLVAVHTKMFLQVLQKKLYIINDIVNSLYSKLQVSEVSCTLQGEFTIKNA